MAKDKKVISLDERRRAASARAGRPGTERPGPARGAPPGSPSGGAGEGGARTGPFGSGTVGGGTVGSGTVGSGTVRSDPAPGRLIWLFCPACRTLEYTELALSGGRVHNACGTPVQEAAVELDLRAEATVAHINLERVALLQGLLDGQRQRYEDYLRRLQLAAGRALEPYAVAEETVEALPVADVDAFGLLVSRFFANPAQHFPELAADAPPESPPAGASDE